MNEKKKTINYGEDIWSPNFYDAKRFFESKGNANTRSRLKDKWHKNLAENIKKALDEQEHWILQQLNP